MPQIRVDKLGLAAFIMLHGGKLLQVVNREFVVETEKSESEWQVEYSNSCCMQHDALVCQLRQHLKRKPD